MAGLGRAPDRPRMNREGETSSARAGSVRESPMPLAEPHLSRGAPVELT